MTVVCGLEENETINSLVVMKLYTVYRNNKLTTVSSLLDFDGFIQVPVCS
jgi:hypothetical protein